MPSRASRIAARLAGLTAAAEEKPPRDDLRKRYKEDDIAKEDRADYKDTHGDPDMMAGASGRTASGWTVDKKFDFEYRGKTGHAKVHYTLMSNGRDVDNFSGEIKWDKGGTTHIPETRLLGVYGRYANKEIIDALVKCIREIECGIRDWQGHLKASAALKAARLARVARSIAAAYRLDRRYLERDILKICENGQNAVHRYNENLYLVAEAKGNPRGAVMEFHWQNARGESFGLATVKEDRFGQNTPAQAANRLFNDYAKSSLRIFR